MYAVKRPLMLLAGASVSAGAGAGYFYYGDERKSVTTARDSIPARKARPRTLTAVSKQELGLQQSYLRELACWMSSASVAAARRALAASQTSRLSVDPAPLALLGSNGTLDEFEGDEYRHIFKWLSQLTPEAVRADGGRIVRSANFSMLMDLISAVEGASPVGNEFEQHIYAAVGMLAADPKCAVAIATKATRYGKQALLNMARTHEEDSRVGDALHRLVVLDSDQCSFGPANLVSLLSLAVADVPDAYLEFALWGLSKAASSECMSSRYRWRKALLRDDIAAKTRRKLISNNKLWDALSEIGENRSADVQLQAAELVRQLSAGSSLSCEMRRHEKISRLLLKWVSSTDIPLACCGLDIVSNIAQSGVEARNQLISTGILDILRVRLLENADSRMTAKLLNAVQSIAEPVEPGAEFVLDQDSLSFVGAIEDDDPLEQDDLLNPKGMANFRYVDGWIELFTEFMKNDDQDVRATASRCLQQIALFGTYKDQGMQEWLIAVLDGVLDKLPPEVAASSSSVRDARSRTRPMVGHEAETSQYEASHAKALRALAFVVGQKDCQTELGRLGGIPLLKTLMVSDNILVQRETARVLANMLACDNMDQELEGFARSDEQLPLVLDQWSQSPDVKLQSVAHRARSNRNYQIAKGGKSSESNEVKYLDGVHPLHDSTLAYNSKQSNGSNYDVDIVLIHGLLGSPYETWKCGDSDDSVWAQEWLMNDLQEHGHNPRVISIGYDSQLLASKSVWQTMRFEETSSEILAKLSAAQVGTGDRPVVFVTHSLGGVLLKQVLLDSANAEATMEESRLVDNVNGVLFYGVPHHGSSIARTVQAFKPRRVTQHPITEHLHGTPHLKMLNEWCGELFEEKGIPSLSIGESAPCRLPFVGLETIVVPQSSANPGFGEFVQVADATHVDVCKPRSKDDLRYTLAHDFIIKNIQKQDCVNS